MIVAVDPADVDKTMEAIRQAGDTPYVVGQIIDGEKGVDLMLKNCSAGIRWRHQPAGHHGCCRRWKNHKYRRSQLVISNNKNAYALERAAKAGIPKLLYLSERLCGPEHSFMRHFWLHWHEAQVDLIVLAGFLVVIPEMMIRNIQKSDHQHSSVSDSVILRNRILWFEST